ncbi:3'-5' exonuclease, partial [uncultured Rhodoblastus sp.]|uniref:3'-5' exonuclease n=1 Tax=uncultured Rhodoblastus sp. TaxID=543037 RepID=UPI0025CFE091
MAPPFASGCVVRVEKTECEPSFHITNKRKIITMTSEIHRKLEAARLETLAQILEASPDYRVLRALDIKATPEPPPGMFDDVRVLVVDVETTGLDAAADTIVEIAARPIVMDYLGAVVHIGEAVAFFQDPGSPLPLEIIALTGLTDDDLRGQNIDDDAVHKLFENAELVIAHNANFDRRFIERRFPSLPLRPWACSFAEIDWRAEGFEGKGLNALLMQIGLFQPAAHRAANDVDALVGLLMANLSEERTVVKTLFESSRRPSLLFEATGSAFATKGVLRARGYQWSQASGVWSREVQLPERAEEEY